MSDSTQPGYLAPQTETLEGVSWENFLQELVAGVSGLDPTLVRPRWQPIPPNTPDVTVDWCAVGITRVESDWDPVRLHYSQEPGYNRLHRHEIVTYLCSFYGPHAVEFAGVLRDGLFIEQNRAVLRVNAAGLVEVSEVRRTADLFREQFRDRFDLDVVLRREVRRVYLIRNLLRSRGPIIANDFGDRVIETEFDTDEVVAPRPLSD